MPFDDDLADRIRRRLRELQQQPQPGRKRRRGRHRTGGGALDLGAFLLDRRDFLAASAGGLAAAMLPGCHGSSLNVQGLLSTATATQLRAGTELFQDSVYAQPVVARNAVRSHAIVEGARQRPRVQSDLVSNDPAESAFLDTGYHHGLPELIQIEDDPESGEPVIVHYRHPTGARTDGARTDGLVRDVLMTKADGLVDPTSLVAVTGSFTNKFGPCCTGGASENFAYMVFVEDRTSVAIGHLLVGYGEIATSSPTGEPSVFRQWTSEPVSHGLMGMNEPADFVSWTKYTSAAWVSPQSNAAPTYQAEQHVEHIVLNLTAGSSPAFLILTLMDGHGIAPEVTLSRVAVPDSPYPLQLAHLDWDPTANDYRHLTNLAVITSRPHSTAGWNYYVYGLRMPTASVENLPLPDVRYNFLDLKGEWKLDEIEFTGNETEQGTYKIDYQQLRDVHTLHSTHVADTLYHVKLGRVADGGPVLFLIAEDGGGFFLGGQFPLTFPDDAGLGKLTTLTGGTSRFGGFRYVASDTDGNVFLMRQRRSLSVDSPYAPPIYGINDGNGQPRTMWTGVHDPLPAATAGASNLHQLNKWVNTSTTRTQLPVYNFLLDAALAFGTDESSLSQAVWLGNTFVAAFAARHMTSDSEHIAITQGTNTDTGELEYRALAVFKNPVDKTWRQRQIATQVLPKGPGLQESGDHYQATVALTNDAGEPVSLQSGDDANLWIEVRADSPCTVVDDTSNLFYDVDRYTSFFAQPSPSTGKLMLLVKAENFAQVLYVRLVDANNLQPNASDPALLQGDVNASPWLAVNLAQQAQERMSATGSAGASTPDDGVYVSSTTLSDSNAQDPWQTKAGFTASSDTFDNLATYLNTSGQNLIANAGDFGLAAGPSVDPLFALTDYTPPLASQPTLTTHYNYFGGAVTNTVSPATSGGAPLGSLFSSVSHALHDALHWLQHVEADVYRQLAVDGVKVISANDGITVKIAPDIMKAVNGVEHELDEAVTTIEEYGGIIANLVVTIVEHTFIYRYIELLISLISLFIHLGDILDFYKSLNKRITDVFDSSSIPLPSSSYSTAESANDYVGPDTQFMSAFALSGQQQSQIPNEVTETVINAVLANPIAAKIQQKISSEIGKAVDAVAGELPIEFPAVDNLVEDIANDVATLERAMVEGVANLSLDVIQDLFAALEASIADPPAIMQNLQTGLTNIFQDFESDVLQPAYAYIDGLATQLPTLARDAIDQDPVVTVNLKSITDLCALLGIGTPHQSNLTLSGREAIVFPMALAMWVTIYAIEGKSISSVDDLAQPASAVPGPLGSSQVLRWDFARLGVAAICQELIAWSWALRVSTTTTQPNVGQKILATNGNALGFVRWFVELLYLVQAWEPDKPSKRVADWRAGSTIVHLVLHAAAYYMSRPDSNRNPGAGWTEAQPRPTDVMELIRAMVSAISMGIDTDLVAMSPATTQDIVNITGQDFQRTQLLAITFFNMFAQAFKPAFRYFVGYAAAAPLGFGVQIAALLL